jgi:aryl-alcohol dehydrogenase-like predicted oxidoreductase
MIARPFGRLGSIGGLGIGNLQPAADGSDWDEVARAYEELLDAGCGLVDTAQCYGVSETFIGARLAHRRDRFLLISKCGHHEVLPDGTWRSRAISMDDIDGALRRLRTDRLDAMLLHSYDLEPLRRGEALGVLRRAKEQGKLRGIGYSGDGERAAWAVEHGGIDVLETSLSLADQANLPTVEAAAASGIAVIAKRPLANAAWRHADPAAAPAHERDYALRLAALQADPAACGCSGIGELALRFVLALPGPPVAIVGARSAANRAANLAAAGRGPLAPQHAAALRARFTALSGGVWPALN